jgi:hypothetical protein
MHNDTVERPFRISDETFGNVDTVFTLLRQYPPRSEREMARFYRRGIRLLHPDRCGDDGARCVRFQELFSAFRLEWNEHRVAAKIEASIDPYRVLRDLGIEGTISPRAAMFATIYRVRSLGLDRWRIRNRHDLKKRNDVVLQTLMFWSYRYDPTATTVLKRFLFQSGGFVLREGRAQLYYHIRRLLLRALDLTVRYQDNGRAATKSIALDILDYAARLLPPPGKERSIHFEGAGAAERWIRSELDKDPDPIGLDM